MIKGKLLFNGATPNSIKINSQPAVTLLVDGKCFWREYTDTTIAPTCTAQGYTRHTAKDGRNQTFKSSSGEDYVYQYDDDIKAALGHNIQSQSVYVTPQSPYAKVETWGDSGIEHYYCGCKICGRTMSAWSSTAVFGGIGNHWCTANKCTRCSYPY